MEHPAAALYAQSIRYLPEANHSPLLASAAERDSLAARKIGLVGP
jgi:hypothetical protein